MTELPHAILTQHQLCRWPLGEDPYFGFFIQICAGGSALPSITDMYGANRYVRFWPKADIDLADFDHAIGDEITRPEERVFGLCTVDRFNPAIEFGLKDDSGSDCNRAEIFRKAWE